MKEIVPQQIIDRMQRIFTNNEPESLYLSPTELAHLDPSVTRKQWKHYLSLPDVQRHIEREIAEEIEIVARKSIRRLSDQDSELTSMDINAIKEILNKSKLLQEKNTSKETVVMLHIPPRTSAPKPEPTSSFLGTRTINPQSNSNTQTLDDIPPHHRI